MQIRIFFIILAGLFACLSPASAQLGEDEHVDLQALYQQIDEEIGRSPQYVAERQARIKQQHDAFIEEVNDEHRLVMAEELLLLYKPFMNDSAIHYAQVCIELADRLQQPAKSGYFRSLLAHQCSNSGMFVESLQLLGEVDKSRLDTLGLTEYYDAYRHVCGEIANLSHLREVSLKYWALQDAYRDSVLMVANEDSDQYLLLRMAMLVQHQQYEEALKVSDLWINKVAADSQGDAMAAYCRHLVYDRMGNTEKVRYWLGRSALSDIRSAVMDQASLITLAELLNYDGDLKRSYRYIGFTWQCNNTFNTRLRSSQVAPVLSLIERNYANVSQRNTLILTVSAVVFCVMAICMFLMFRHTSRQKKHLAEAQQELTEANEKLSETNEKLKWMNASVTKYNKELFDINYELRRERDESLQAAQYVPQP